MSKTAFIRHTAEIAKYPNRYPFLNAAMDGVRDAGWLHKEMLDFLPASPPPAAECARLVRECDAYIGILGFLWGTQVPDRPHVSYTKFEFQVAEEAGKPFSFFLIDESAEGFPAGLTSGIPEGQLKDQQDFRKHVQERSMPKFVRTPEELRLWVCRSLQEPLPISEPGIPKDKDHPLLGFFFAKECLAKTIRPRLRLLLEQPE